jgi:hypothetical protein
MLEAQAAQAAARAKQAKMQDREMALLAQEFKALRSKADSEPQASEPQAAAPDKKSSACVLQ